MYRRFNVATFVNVLIVALIATTISLFVFNGREEGAERAPSVETNAALDVSEVAPIEKTSVAVETAAPVAEIAAVDASLKAETPVALEESETIAESETEIAPDSAPELDALFAEEPLSDNLGGDAEVDVDGEVAISDDAGEVDSLFAEASEVDF
ncbi:MAG: hypothetical protein IJO46_05270, partial [Thermoguttaceae bacterium]|nr:hypothetical protein [Thermoguttaceae bacterium]